jgi:hypothetical protein
LLDELSAEKVLYLADDDALEQVVANWARGIVGADPDEQSIFERAADRCATASSEHIDAFVASERARLRLKVLASVPRDRRTIELLGGRVAIFVYDRATLDEEDVAGASLLVFGKSQESVIKKVGMRTYLAPGAIGSSTGGWFVLDDGAGGVRLEIMSTGGVLTMREVIAAPTPSAKLLVHGDSKL